MSRFQRQAALPASCGAVQGGEAAVFRPPMVWPLTPSGAGQPRISGHVPMEGPLPCRPQVGPAHPAVNGAPALP